MKNKKVNKSTKTIKRTKSTKPIKPLTVEVANPLTKEQDQALVDYISKYIKETWYS